MSEENKPNEENSEEVDQEEMAKQWAEALEEQKSQEEAGDKPEPSQEELSEGQEEVNQEEIAKQWEEALKEQEENKDEEVDQEEIAKQWAEALEEQQSEETSEEQLKESVNKSLENVQDEKLELLMDIPLEISVEIGGRDILLEDILKLNANAVLELDKYINEPVDIKINGKLIAKGELYTVENNFGVKITNIITVQERLKLLFERGE